MPITSEQLQLLSVTSLDEYLKNTPIDQVTQNRPFLKKMLENRKKFGGAKQFIKETLRTTNDSNFKWAVGESQIDFKKRNTVMQSEWPWTHCLDSLYRGDDELFSNGINVVRGKGTDVKLERSEKNQIIDMITEDNEVLRDGFFESLDREIHRDGTASEDAIVGLDALISLNPETGTVGGIDRSKYTWWRNHAAKGLKVDTILDQMGRAWRDCMRRSHGSQPDFILAGWDFIEAYAKSIQHVNNTDAGTAKKLDGGIGQGESTGLFFKGIPIVWDPTFDTLDDLENPEVHWSKRCYMINTKKIKWRENGLDVYNPTGPHDTQALFTVASLRCCLSMNQANSHAVLALG